MHVHAYVCVENGDSCYGLEYRYGISGLLHFNCHKLNDL